MRADALRNRDALVSAAAEVFAENSVDAPLDDVARRAGVGHATRYRHFPTRRDLLVAVYADEATAMRAYAEVLIDQDAPADALFGWLRGYIAHVAAKRDLAVDGGQNGRRSPTFEQWRDVMTEAAALLLIRAERAGEIRPGLDANDLVTLANGIALAGSDPDQVDRLLALVERGCA